MNLARMMTDRFFIEDRGGARRGPFKTKFGSESIMVFHDGLEVAEGDRIVRPLPDGGEHVYVVEHCALQAGSRHIPSHFALRIAGPGATQAAAEPATRGSADTGPGNPQGIAAALDLLAAAIERPDVPPAQRTAARTLLRALRENPVVAAALSGAGPAP